MYLLISVYQQIVNNMKLNIPFLFFITGLLLFLNEASNAQKYIVFERQKGFNKREFKPGLQLSQNEISLKAADTNLFIFNWYYTPNIAFRWSSLDPSLTTVHDGIANRILITAVPLIAPKENLEVRKLSVAEFKTLKIISQETLLTQTLKDFYVHLNQRKNQMPPLKTIELGLVIKENNHYYMVKHKLLVSQFILRGDNWYFPNEFKNGVLNINPEIKTYQLDEILAFEKDMRKKKIPNSYLEKIYNKIYVSSVQKSEEFNNLTFKFWEYLNDDVVSSLLNIPKLYEFNLGLGSFEFLADVGIINCTLDAYLKKQISFNQTQFLKIITINSLNLKDFQNLYRNAQKE